jgi:hypothetical protein
MPSATIKDNRITPTVELRATVVSYNELRRGGRGASGGSLGRGLIELFVSLIRLLLYGIRPFIAPGLRRAE